MRVSRSMLCVQHVSIVFAEPRCFGESAGGKKCSLSPWPPVANERRSTTVCQKKRAARRYRSSPVSSADALEADDLRDLRVGVQSVERVASLGERREQRLVAEAAGQREIRRVAGQRRDVGEHLVHAAVLGAQHALRTARRSSRASTSAVHSASRVSTSSAERLPACRCASRRPANTLCIVYQGTPMNGRPATAFSSCAAPSGNAQTSPLRAAVWQALQLGHDVVDALLHPVVAGRRVHQRRGAEIVPERVAVAADVRPTAPPTPSRRRPAPSAPGRH